MGRLDGMFNILRVVIDSAENDQILESTGDEQLALEQETQIASPQERSSSVLKTRLKNLSREIVTLPIATGHARSGDPDLADSAIAQILEGLRIGDHDLLIEQIAAAAHQ